MFQIFYACFMFLWSLKIPMFEVWCLHFQTIYALGIPYVEFQSHLTLRTCTKNLSRCGLWFFSLNYGILYVKQKPFESFMHDVIYKIRLDDSEHYIYV